MIKDYSSDWPKKFQEEAALIHGSLGSSIVSLEHIGSTSVPGLSAKPVIDMAVLTNSIQDPSVFVASLEKIGYRYKPDMSSVERLFFRKGHPAKYHLSITEPRYLYWTRQMLFRDYLRNHPEAVSEYAQIKLRLADEVPPEDLKDLSHSKGYNSGKTEFVERILGLAQNEVAK